MLSSPDCNPGAISALLSASPQLLSHKDTHGNTPLHASAAAGGLACLQQLLSSGADVAATNHDGSTPLMLAASNGHTPTLAALADLQPASAIHSRNLHGDTSLEAAAAGGHDAAISFLLSRGADVNSSNTNGSSPLISGTARIKPFAPFGIP